MAPTPEKEDHPCHSTERRRGLIFSSRGRWTGERQCPLQASVAKHPNPRGKGGGVVYRQSVKTSNSRTIHRWHLIAEGLQSPDRRCATGPPLAGDEDVPVVAAPVGGCPAVGPRTHGAPRPHRPHRPHTAKDTSKEEYVKRGNLNQTKKQWIMVFRNIFQTTKCLFDIRNTSRGHF